VLEMQFEEKNLSGLRERNILNETLHNRSIIF